MSFKSFETSYLDCVWYELSESVAKIVKICHFTRNNQKFHFFDPKIKWIFWRGSRVPRHFKLTQLVYLCIKQILCKFQVDRTIVAPPRSDFAEISPYLVLTPSFLRSIFLSFLWDMSYYCRYMVVWWRPTHLCDIYLDKNHQ